MSQVIVFLANQVSGDMEFELRTEVAASIVECIRNVKNGATYNSDLKLIFVEKLMEAFAFMCSKDGVAQIAEVEMMEECCYMVSKLRTFWYIGQHSWSYKIGFAFCRRCYSRRRISAKLSQPAYSSQCPRTAPVTPNRRSWCSR